MKTVGKVKDFLITGYRQLKGATNRNDLKPTATLEYQ